MPSVHSTNHCNLLEREVEKDLVPALRRYGIGLLPYFPLASGLLTGKYRRGEQPPAGSRLAAQRNAGRLAAAPWDTIEALQSYADKRDLSLLDVAIGGLAAKPTVTSVIAGATRPEQVAANAAAGRWVPTAGELAELDAIG